jgi:hypothetical protein
MAYRCYWREQKAAYRIVVIRRLCRCFFHKLKKLF